MSQDAKELIEKITEHLSENVAMFDCQDGCPDEVAIYEKDHPGETLRTDSYCNKCFAGQIVFITEKAGYRKQPELLTEAEIKDKLETIQPDGFNWTDTTDAEMIKFKAISQAQQDKAL